MAEFNGKTGVWRTIGGRRVFIEDGDDLKTAMEKSGKFKRKGYTSEDYQKQENNIAQLKKEEQEYDRNYKIGNVDKGFQQEKEMLYDKLREAQNKYKEMERNPYVERKHKVNKQELSNLEGINKQSKPEIYLGGDGSYMLDLPEGEETSYGTNYIQGRTKKEVRDEYKLYKEGKQKAKNEAENYYSKLTQYQAREDLDMRKSWLDDNLYDESRRKEYEDFYKQGEEYYKNKYGSRYREEKDYGKEYDEKYKDIKDKLVGVGKQEYDVKRRLYEKTQGQYDDIDKFLDDKVFNKDDSEYKLYKKAMTDPDSIDPMTENSTDWEALENKFGKKYNDEIVDSARNVKLPGKKSNTNLNKYTTSQLKSVAEIYDIDTKGLSRQELLQKLLVIFKNR